MDPRGPDGVTILATYAQARPSAYPGRTTGDTPRIMMLFDIAADPAEQNDVSCEHPDVVSRLKALFDRTSAELPKLSQPRQFKSLRRLKGGTLNYEE